MAIRLHLRRRAACDIHEYVVRLSRTRENYPLFNNSLLETHFSAQEWISRPASAFSAAANKGIARAKWEKMHYGADAENSPHAAAGMKWRYGAVANWLHQNSTHDDNFSNFSLIYRLIKFCAF